MGEPRNSLAGLGGLARRVVQALGTQASRLIDRDRLVGATTAGQRLAAVSWPRAALLMGVVGLVGAGGFWLAERSLPRAHPPELPSEHEVRVGQDAIETFMDGRPACVENAQPSANAPENES